MKANYINHMNEMKKNPITIEEAINRMVVRIPKKLRAQWKEIFEFSLGITEIGGIYADTLFQWKKVDAEHVVAL